MAEQPLQGQVAVVTGGASGIGRATVLALAELGAAIAVLDRVADAAHTASKEAEQLGVKARAFEIDLADTGAIDGVVDAVLAEFGRIDILVNSAGVSTTDSIVDFTDESFDRTFAINLKAPFALTRAVAPQMIERGEGGRIVSLSSSASARATAAPCVYAATKSGINGFTRSVAADLGMHGINVNAVAPGVTKTPMTEALTQVGYDQVVTTGPLANLLQRPSEPEDVANVIAFLCLPDSRQITGQVIHTSAGLVV
jgi:NAD(P)-dependent dehydrogenase (short-subunit alcohol dehydrogenase family)